jgi:DNA-directed RNA polymerase specialized sigma54-like protein
MESPDRSVPELVDSQTIAAHMNRLLNPKGITAQVSQTADHLQVRLTSAQPLNQSATVAFICRRVESFNIEPIATITIAACQPGQEMVAWSQEVQRHSPTLAVQSDPSPYLPTDTPVTHPSDSPDPRFESAPISTSTLDTAIASDAIAERMTAVELSPSGASAQPIDDSPNEAIESLPDWLQRPEAVVLIIFASLVLLWDLYLDLIGDVESDRPLTAQELSRRLGVTSSTISRRKERLNFTEWSQDLDPDGIGWSYRDGLFFPQIPLLSEPPMID